MVYGPVGSGLFGVCGETYPKRVDDDGLCDCGRAALPGDFLCHRCREHLKHRSTNLQDIVDDHSIKSEAPSGDE